MGSREQPKRPNGLIAIKTFKTLYNTQSCTKVAWYCQPFRIA